VKSENKKAAHSDERPVMKPFGRNAGWLNSRQWLQTGRGFEREQAMQQHIACAIDAHVQAVAAATAAATVARLTREDGELWLSGWCMIGPGVN
jgi:hypothetical protein